MVSVAASDALPAEFVVIQKELFSSFGLHYRPVPRIKCTVHPPTESSTLKLGCLVGKCTARFQAPATAQIIRHAASTSKVSIRQIRSVSSIAPHLGIVYFVYICYLFMFVFPIIDLELGHCRSTRRTNDRMARFIFHRSFSPT